MLKEKKRKKPFRNHFCDTTGIRAWHVYALLVTDKLYNVTSKVITSFIIFHKVFRLLKKPPGFVFVS